MAIQKITFDAASVSSKMDADINHFLTSGVNGIFYGILGRCQASVSNNYISFQNGYVQVYGRRIFVESGTKMFQIASKTESLSSFGVLKDIVE